MKHFKNQWNKLRKLKIEEKVLLLFATFFYTLQILFITIIIPLKRDPSLQINSTFVLTVLYILCGLMGLRLAIYKRNLPLLLTLYCPVSIATILTSDRYEILALGALCGILSGAILGSLKHRIQQLIYSRKRMYHLLTKTYRVSFILAFIVVILSLTRQAEEKQLYVILGIAILSLFILFSYKIFNLIHNKQTKDQ